MEQLLDLQELVAGSGPLDSTVAAHHATGTFALSSGPFIISPSILSHSGGQARAARSDHRRRKCSE
jgi:hypothetical protein